jgi:histidyl-tRNA synthetase
MNGNKKMSPVKARLPKGTRDVEAQELRALKHMLGTIAGVYERYGFEPLDTPAFEYTDALGKFLPDTDRPNEGVFSFQDDDEQWVSLRYDLTAPLARYVAANFDALPKPFRRYQTGYVYRNEKPGPGRFRQFMQFDADTVGTANPAADAEMCMLAADTLEALGIPRGSYLVKLSSRTLLDSVLDNAGILIPRRRLAVLRAVDKFERLGLGGVADLLGKGRKDESGDFTPGAELEPQQKPAVLALLSNESPSADATVEAVLAFVRQAGYGADRIRFDPAIVRGLEYYTGPVFEAELTFEEQRSGDVPRFGSVVSGGRYDGLVSRFRSQPVPATGVSIGVSRLYAALAFLGKLGAGEAAAGPVVVLVMDRDRTGDYQKMAQELRRAGIRAEMYVGDAGMKAQMKYADRRGSPCVIIQGEDERARGEVTIKDLVEGARLSSEIAGRGEWREARPAQYSVPASGMVEEVRLLLERQLRG